MFCSPPFVLPCQGALDIGALSRLFKSTSSTYKFYWALSLLDLLKLGKKSFPMGELIARMLWYACFPVNVCRLELGPNDSLRILVKDLQDHLASRTPELHAIRELLKRDSAFAKKASILKRMVPFCFLSPWLGSKTFGAIKLDSQKFTNNCLYAIGNDQTISINPNWLDYLQRQGTILRDFTLWHLTQYLQMRNPNVPNIPGKVLMPEKRDSLVVQHKWWDKVLAKQSMKCIYSNLSIVSGNYDLDHFIPWSFVAHNQLWNLIPANQSVNSSKNDRLPDLDRYLHSMAKMQHKAIRVFTQEYGMKDRLLQDFWDLKLEIPRLVEMSEDEYANVLRINMAPMVDIASNMGFEKNWIYAQ